MRRSSVLIALRLKILTSLSLNQKKLYLQTTYSKLLAMNTENKFFTFIRPYLNLIDTGRLFRNPFSWIYILFAAANILFPLFLVYDVVDRNFFDYADSKLIIVFIFTFLFISFACWLGFQLWLDRKNKVITSSSEDDEFVATHVFSHFVQTFGEWLGTWIAIVGFGVSLIATIVLGDEAGSISYVLGMDFIEFGIMGIILMPIYGFMIIIVTRFIAEASRALASIANNTKK